MTNVDALGALKPGSHAPTDGVSEMTLYAFQLSSVGDVALMPSSKTNTVSPKVGFPIHDVSVFPLVRVSVGGMMMVVATGALHTTETPIVYLKSMDESVIAEMSLPTPELPTLEIPRRSLPITASA
jgi:hypothetical protein